MSKRRTQQQLEDMARDTPGAHIEFDNDEGIAVLVVNGKETGDYSRLCAFPSGGAA